VARLFGTDGVRGAYDLDLTDDLARALGHAAATVLGGEASHPRIVIGRDTRVSGPALERALAAGIAAAGGVPLSAGVIPTPGVAFLVGSYDAAAGVVISASHNPPMDNGIKFFGSDGRKLPDETEDEIEAAMDGVDDPPVEPQVLRDAHERYIDFLDDGVPALGGLRVVVDCANGAAGAVVPEAYDRAGADVVPIFASPDGSAINDGCGSTHPEALQRAVVEHGADLGIAHDGDADRMIAVDPAGQIVDGDQVLGICALDAKARRALKGNAIVTTVMANMGLRRAMASAGIDVIETQVGDRYVLAVMLKEGLILGGEQSGHLLFLDRHTTGDGILTALKLMSVMAARGSSLADLAARIPRFPQVMRNVAVRDRDELGDAARVWDAVDEVEAELADEGRVLVRASGTEQLVRVMAEAPTEARAHAAVDRIVSVVEAELA
jgi:phosphoglucosamine mutase